MLGVVVYRGKVFKGFFVEKPSEQQKQSLKRDR